MTQSSSGIEIYVNGSLDYSNGTTITTAVGTVYIGASFDNREWWNGRIAQVLFYNKKLTAAEIKQNYNATKRRYGL
jgi:K+-transporting ATPase c subunit